MNEPRRLNRSGGAAQLLLDSASLDRPGAAARHHAASLAATASTFARTHSNVAALSSRRVHPVKTLVVWLAVGAAASVTLGFVASKLLGSAGTLSAAAPLATLSSVPAPPPAVAAPDIASDIAPEPPRPSATLKPRRAAPADELREIEAARATLARGDAARALAQLDAYDASHPSGHLEPDAMALRIQALTKSGRETEARALTSEFFAKYPGHPLKR